MVLKLFNREKTMDCSKRNKVDVRKGKKNKGKIMYPISNYQRDEIYLDDFHFLHSSLPLHTDTWYYCTLNKL